MISVFRRILFKILLEFYPGCEVEYTYKYMEVIGCESVKKGVVTEDFIHMIVTAYFNGMFEVVRHGMPKEDAVRYIGMLNRYHMAGFDTIFNAQCP